MSDDYAPQTLNEEDFNDDPEDDESFGVELAKAGDGGYHTSNDPSAPNQRHTVTERRGPVDIRCKAREVVHGDFGGDSTDFATLLVYDFHFDATKRFRRVASANVTFMFSGSAAGAQAPTVHAIAPFGRYALLSTTQDESYTREGDVKAEASQMGATLGGSYKWSKTINRTTSSDTRVVGTTVCNKYGREVGVNWVLHENETTKTGVPSFLRTAILLRRKQNDRFQCTFKIDVEADWKTDMTRFFGSKGKDDPILFDPDLPPTNTLRKSYDVKNLGSIAVDDIFDTTFQTTFGNAVKVHPSAGESTK